MSRAKQSPSRKRLKKAAPVLGAAAGLSLSLASGASAGPTPDMPTPGAGAGHEIILAEEEISDVSLATFYVFDKENTATFRPNIQLARGGCGGGCGGGGCRGCGGGKPWRLWRVRRLWRLWRLWWVLDLRGLRRLLGVCRMCSGLVGCSAAACVFLSAAGQAAIDTVKAAAQRRRKACGNACQ